MRGCPFFCSLVLDMNLLILTDKDTVEHDRYRLTDHRAEHVRAVLRAKKGDFVEVGLLNGPIGRATIEQLNDDEVVLRCGQLEESPAIRPTVDLICALPRPQTLKKVLITAAMMGVRQVHFIRANRVEKSYFQSPLITPEKQMPFLLEGLSQGKLTQLPKVEIHDRFRPFFEDYLPSIEESCPEGENPIKLLADPETTSTLKDHYISGDARLVLAVGPEGGWVPFEVDLMVRQGFRRFTLGRWTLRVENAVTAALSQVELIRIS